MDDSTLSDEQKLVLQDILDLKNVLVTGPGGTGKSYLLNYLRRWFRGRGKMDICGATGIAAANVGGVTLHSWAGIGLGDGSANKLALQARNNKPAFDRIRGVEVLAIDEVSMIDAGLLDKLNEVFQLIREDERPFGGVQMLFLGDFYQLPPVKGDYAFKAKAWRKADIAVHVFHQIHRQSEADFARALMELRTGELSPVSKDLLNSRHKAKVGSPECPPIYLTTHNEMALRLNEGQLSLLPGKAEIFHARDTGTESGIKVLDKSKIPKELHLKVGARVICCTNYLPDAGVMNGSAGTVVALENFMGVLTPVVRFDNGEELRMNKVAKEITLDGHVIATRTQFPLRLGWALTVHSSQGMTLDLVEAHLGNAFERGQIYVALSRVRTLGGLSIQSLNKHLIAPCEKAAAFYAEADPFALLA
jgi:ATP-dependent DNA helicase PIF1